MLAQILDDGVGGAEADDQVERPLGDVQECARSWVKLWREHDSRRSDGG